MWLGDVIVLLFISTISYLFWRRKRTFSCFEKYGVPYVKPNFIFGNTTDVFLRGKARATVLLDLYWKLDPHKIGGVFNMSTPVFLVRDPQMLKNVLIKDFEYFQDHANITLAEDDLLSENLFSLKGQKWKNLRIKFTPMFTSGKIKMMFPTVEDCGKNISDVLKVFAENQLAFEMKELTTKFAIDVIASCAFGIQTDCLKNPDNEFAQRISRIFKNKEKLSASLLLLWANMPTKIIKWLGIRLIEKDIQCYLKNIIETTVKYREENNVTRNDLLDVAIALKHNTVLEKHQDNGDTEDLDKLLAQIGDKLIKSDVEMTDELLTAQGIGFLLAGSDTTANTLAFAIFEIAQNPLIQHKLREEITVALQNNDGQLTYELVKDMTYLDMVVLETLRKYPSSIVLLRECLSDYKVPNTETVIPAKSAVVVPLIGIHNDSKYYQYPDKFYPEHFTEEAKARRPRYTFLPFGDGPRICIAERLAKMQMKIALICMLKDFTFCVSPKMKLPLEFGNDFGLTAKHGFWLNCNKI